MPDVEKIIKALEHHKDTWVCNGCPYEDDPAVGNGKCPVYDDAIALLREQEKTKVVFRQYDGSVESECGNCGLYLDKTYSVCPKCGKELDWNA